MLTSSAVGGSKAKPKAPPRRRPPQNAPAKAAPAVDSQPVEEGPSSAVPSEIPAGQALDSSATAESHAVQTIEQAIPSRSPAPQTPAPEPQDVQPTITRPSPPTVVGTPVQASMPPAPSVPIAPMRGVVTTPTLSATGTVSSPKEARQSLPSESNRTARQASEETSLFTPQTTQEEEVSVETNGRKRKRQTAQPKAPAPNKRVKRSAQRSSAIVQAIAQGDAVEPQHVAQGAEPEPVEATQPAQPRRAAQRRTTQARGTKATPARATRSRKKAAPVAEEVNEGSPVDQNAREELGAANSTGEEAHAIHNHAEENDDHTDGLNTATDATVARPVPRKPRRTRKRATKTDTEDTDVVVADAEVDGDMEAEAEAELSDPEDHRIDPASLSMYDLSLDGRYGKTSEREKKMAQIDWAAVRRKRKEEADAIARGDFRKDKENTNAVPSTENANGQAAGDDDPPEAVTQGTTGGIQFRVVGGQIVEDETSLTIDRAARITAAAAADDNAPVEEENDLTVRFNRTTYINARKRDETERVPLWRSKSDAWSEDDTDRFYDALRMFGTDFFIISKMFPPRTRKQIKLKFVREERLEPERINNALLGINGVKTEKIDLDHYAQAIDRDVADFHKYDGLEHANEVIKASMADKEEAMRAAVKEDEENTRQREVQRQQREKQRLDAERKKEERKRRNSAKRRGDVWGTGALGAADDDGDAEG